MKVEQWMTRNVECISPDETVGMLSLADLVNDQEDGQLAEQTLQRVSQPA